MTPLALDSVFVTLAALIVKVSLMVAIAAVAHGAAGRRASAASRHLILTVAVIGLLALPLLEAIVPRWTVPVPVSAPIVPAVTPFESGAAPVDSSPAPLTDDRSVGGIQAEATSSASSSVPQPRGTAWAMLPMALYPAGVLLFLIRLAAERSTVKRLARSAVEMTDPEWQRLFAECARASGVTQPVRLMRSRERTMPMVCGVRAPSILMPAVADTWSEERRRAVLLHELAHVARHDCLTQMMAAFACALYWMHPGVWWIARRLRVERELACDDRVLSVGTHARDYAGHLLELAYSLATHRAPALVVTMARPGQLERRMLAVLDAARNRTAPALRSRVAGFAVAAAVVVPLAGLEASIVPRVENGAGLLADPAMASSTGIPATADGRASAATLAGGPQTATAAAQPKSPGTWEMRLSQTAGSVDVRMTEGHSSHGTVIPIDRFSGISATQLSTGAGPVHFTLRRDAGTFVFDGVVRSGVGTGTYTFSFNAAFPDELMKRGLARPSSAEQYELARQDIGFAFLEELTAQGYQKASLAQIVAAAQHGIDPTYLREMGRAGYRLGNLDALVRQREHGVTPQYIRELGAQGLTGLSAEDLVRARDHGVSPEYVRELRQFGYQPLTLNDLAAARDHGVSAEYVRDMRARGYRLSLAQFSGARDHGISAEYVSELESLGYRNVTLEGLTNARDHGVAPEYIRALREHGYHLTLEELSAARDHGVDADYVRQLAALGYKGVPIELLTQFRDHGITPEFIRNANASRPGQLGTEAILRLKQQQESGSPNLHTWKWFAHQHFLALMKALGLY